MRKLRIAALVLGVAVLAYVGVWFGISEYVRGEIAEALEEQIPPPAEFSHGEMTRGGFPLGITWAISDFRFRTPYEGGSVDGTIERVVLGASLLEPESPLAAAERIGLTLKPEKAERVVLGADGMKVWLGEKDETTKTDYRLSGLFIEDFASASEAVGTFLSRGKGPEAADSTTLAISEIAPVAGSPGFLPEGPGRADLRITINGERLFEAKEAEDYEEWRDDGGTIVVESLVFDWPETRVTADATLTLDEKLRPEGSGTVTVKGGKALVDHWRRTGVINEAAAAVLGLKFSALGKMVSDLENLGKREKREERGGSGILGKLGEKLGQLGGRLGSLGRRGKAGNQEKPVDEPVDAEISLPLSIKDGQFCLGPFCRKGVAPIVR